MSAARCHEKIHTELSDCYKISGYMSDSPQPFALNLRHLRAIAEIAGRGTLSAAAEAVGLSQPALTQGLGKLERQLGLKLFERRSDGVVATPAVGTLADRIERAFSHLATGGRRVKGGGGFVRPERLMTATQLNAFLHFADAQSFAAAATASGLSQPAIHRAVRDLEAICATPLVERRGRGVALTPAGLAMARGTRLAARELAAGFAEVRGDGSDVDRIAVGAMPLSRALILPKAIAAFLSQEPDTVIDVVEGSWRELIEPLLDGVIDLMIGALRDDPPPGVVQTPLFTDRLRIYGRAGHPLAGARDIDLGRLANQQWVVGPVGTPLRAHWEALFAGASLPQVPVECGSVMVIRGLLVETDLLTLLSPDQVALEVAAGILVPIGPAPPEAVRTIGISVRADWRPTVRQQHLLKALNDASSGTRNQENQ